MRQALRKLARALFAIEEQSSHINNLFVGFKAIYHTGMYPCTQLNLWEYGLRASNRVCMQH